MALLNKNVLRNIHEQHPFHMVNPSPWPLFTSFSLMALAISFLLYFNFYKHSSFYLSLSFCLFMFFLCSWFSDIVTESTYEGFHTQKVQNGLSFGMILFIASEVMFFFSFFWAFLHCSLSASVDIGSMWPPKYMCTLDPWSLPLVNTIILLSSGVTMTWAHKAILDNRRFDVIFGIVATISYGFLFSLIQYYEYMEAPFNINDGIYGSLFFLLTGFHGFHVAVGSIFLVICLMSQMYYHFTAWQHIGFECAIYYWHFVDVVWLFLFILVYIWGS